jgi:hypothetical protein
VRQALLGLPTGRVSLQGLANQLGIVLDLAPDGVPTGPRYRQLPPLRHWPVPALSKLPTSGACARKPGPGRLATAGIFIDTPQPRCLVVGSRQGLRIYNHTGRYGGAGRTITVRFIGFHRRIRPGEAAVFRRPVGTYLAPGDHQVTSTFRGIGPEVLYRR